jgi:hypothetical protein
MLVLGPILAIACASSRGTIHLPIREVTVTPRDLCPTAAPGSESRPLNAKGPEVRRSASVKRDRDWIVITVDESDGTLATSRRTHLSATRAHYKTMDLGCGRTLLLEPGSAQPTALPPPPSHIVAEAGSQRTEIASAQVELVDFHEDWDGGSGGMSIEARVKDGWLEVSTTDVYRHPQSGEGHASVVDAFDLSAFRSEKIESPMGPIIFTAVP